MSTLAKSPPMKKFLRFSVFVIIGFTLGGGAAYITNMKAAKHAEEQAALLKRQQPAPPKAGGGGFEVVGEGGRLKLVPRGGTESPAAFSGEDPNAAGAAAAAADAGPEDALVDGMTLAELKRQARMKAHVQPGIGMYVPGTFTLKDENGEEVTEKSWPGKYLLVFFGFAHCPDICPVTLDKMAKALEKLGPLAAKVQPLFITVDPARDTPGALKDYTGKFSPELVGLTGTEEQVKDAMESFKVYAQRAAGETQTEAEYNIDHSAFVYFMSPENRLEEVLRIEHSTDTVVERIKPYLLGTAAQKPMTP